MNEQDQSSNTLPPDFDGVIRFTNWTDRDFAAKWNSVEYTFPAHKTSPLIIMGETPEGIQNIRRKFAKELGEREFYLSESFKTRNNVRVGENPALYTLDELAPYIQKCLEPLPIEIAKTKLDKKDTDRAFRTDERGNKRTKVLDRNESLIPPGSSVEI